MSKKIAEALTNFYPHKLQKTNLRAGGKKNWRLKWAHATAKAGPQNDIKPSSALNCLPIPFKNPSFVFRKMWTATSWKRISHLSNVTELVILLPQFLLIFNISLIGLEFHPGSDAQLLLMFWYWGHRPEFLEPFAEISGSGRPKLLRRVGQPFE